jgi:S1-C subfamily serine protease
MNRLRFIAAVFLLILLSARANADEFLFRFVETKDNKIRVTSVDSKGLAAQMGMRQDDIIVRIDNTNIDSKTKLDSALRSLLPQTGMRKFTVVVDRPGEKNKTLPGQIQKSSAGFYYVR